MKVADPECVGDRLAIGQKPAFVGVGISYDCFVNKRFRVCSLDQQFLLPPSLQDWLPEGHLARFIADVVNELDLSAIYATYERGDLTRVVGISSASDDAGFTLWVLHRYNELQED